jgi:hypothetical protein
VWPEQPVIISVQPLVFVKDSGEDDTSHEQFEDVLIICATKYDAQILLSSAHIDLVGGSSILIKSVVEGPRFDEVLSSRSESAPPSPSSQRFIHILW